MNCDLSYHHYHCIPNVTAVEIVGLFSSRPLTYWTTTMRVGLLPHHPRCVLFREQQMAPLRRGFPLRAALRGSPNWAPKPSADGAGRDQVTTTKDIIMILHSTLKILFRMSSSEISIREQGEGAEHNPRPTRVSDLTCCKWPLGKIYGCIRFSHLERT